MEVIKKFTPLVKKYSRKLNYDGADTDLIISLIETTKHLSSLGNNIIKEDKYIVGYISRSIKNKYIYLSKKYSKIYEKEIELNLDITSIEEYEEECILIKMLIDKLPELQRKIIIERFMKDYTDAEIANELNISRQAVNKTKNRALNNLKNIWGKNNKAFKKEKI